ncbi:sister chromatid cohesion 1 protein 1 [Diospyros lotus]|uniref:sister chromatid cohesion 1 protein 1 n=1 Tax=Diospyros lotus TaxID=55363 RepID=UPI0022581FDE|nr:sister chromatid cohesion 1 protein 1 [Diospyros lotus]
MFYSHQLLARKAPLGQIWMAATMHAKINRRKLDKLNIIKICEEILNPSVPMALRLSGILMGGVVIVYERKVKLLYDDVTRLLVEINEAWKVKVVPDPTLLPKGKSQAKFEAVTLPMTQEIELEEIELSLNNTNRVEFEHTDYFAMRLDDVEDPYINSYIREEDQSVQYHQADAANITLFERYDSYQTDADAYNRFERFDIEGDNETELNSHERRIELPSTLIPSPPRPQGPQEPDEIFDQHPEDQVNQKSDEGKESSKDHQIKRPARRKARKPAALEMDYEQTIIPGQIYQSWLQSASDIVSRRGRKRKHSKVMSTMKIGSIMELPPVALISGLFNNGNREIQYPAPLLELWMRCTQLPRNSSSGKTSPPHPPEPSLSSPPHIADYNAPVGSHVGDFHSGFSSEPLVVSWEKHRGNLNINEVPADILVEGLTNKLVNNGANLAETNVMVTPKDSGDKGKSLSSSGSGHGFLSNNSEVNSGRSNKKRPYSSSRHSSSSLDPLAEEHSWEDPDPNFKLARLSENGPTPEYDLLVETAPTQTQLPIPTYNQPVDQITDSIRMQLKKHFETPGSARAESLNQLAFGMNKTRAAHLFYQTCVLATRDFVRVEQRVPYGDILISRGAKM